MRTFFKYRNNSDSQTCAHIFVFLSWQCLVKIILIPSYFQLYFLLLNTVLIALILSDSTSPLLIFYNFFWRTTVNVQHIQTCSFRHFIVDVSKCYKHPKIFSRRAAFCTCQVLLTLLQCYKIAEPLQMTSLSAWFRSKAPCHHVWYWGCVSILTLHVYCFILFNCLCF